MKKTLYIAAGIVLGLTTVHTSAYEWWTPSELTNTVAWYDAADASSITNTGSTVDRWNDKSGNGRYSQQWGMFRPAYVTNSLGGHATISFDGIDDRLTIYGTAFAARNLFIVLNAEDGAVFSGWNWAFGSKSSPDVCGLYASPGNTTIGTDLGGAGKYVNGVATTQFAPLSSFKIVSFVGSSLSASGSNWWIGEGDDNWHGKIAEIIVTTDVATDAYRQKIEGYLAWKWGLVANLPAGHPYKSLAPGQPPRGTVFIFR